MGSAAPDKVMTNEDFEKILDTSDEWITQRTGIKERRLCREDETTSQLAAQAARNALDDAGLTPDELDLIICGTVSGDLPFPATACLVQDALGITNIPAFDVSAACSGYIYALTVGKQFVETGAYENVLVIGADCLSKMADYEDRGSCILFGDGAGASILQPTTEEDKGIVFTTLACNGSGWDYIHIPAGGTARPFSQEVLDSREHFIKMRGRDVYKFAVEKMQWLLGECMDKAGLSVDDVDLVVPHQVNTRIIASATQKFDFPIEKVYVNIETYGNTSAASIPLAFDQAKRSGACKPGDTIILVAFGAGLTWAGAVVKM
jgi:3-oxoacyl-[acyl-carrier-protein] synthase-3